MSYRRMKALAIGLVILAVVIAVLIPFLVIADAYRLPETTAEALPTEAAKEIRIIKATVKAPPKPTEETPETFATNPPTEPETEAPTEPAEPTRPEPVKYLIPEYAAELIGRTIWGEAQGVESQAERAAVAWCILNRADAWGMTIWDVVRAPNQFHGYRYHGECPQQFIDEAADVLSRWQNEKRGFDNVGRTLPAGYLYFYGDGERNHFTQEWGDGETWDWSLPDPYK